MITNAVLAVFASVVAAILGVIPQIPVPSWFSGAGDAFGKVYAFLNSLSPWFPVPLALSVLGALLTIKVASFGFMILRKIVSLFTGGGLNGS